MWWNYLSIPKLQRCSRWSLGMDKLFHLTLYWACGYLSMLGSNIINVSKQGSRAIDRVPGIGATKEVTWCHWHQDWDLGIFEVRLCSSVDCIPLMWTVLLGYAHAYQCIRVNNAAMRHYECDLLEPTTRTQYSGQDHLDYPSYLYEEWLDVVCLYNDTWDPFYSHRRTLILAWISIY